MATDKITQKELKAYYRKIESALVCNKEKKSEIMQSVKTMTEDCITENKPESFEALTSRLGAPQDVASSFCETSPKYIKKRLSIKRAVIIALAAIVAIVAIFFVALFINEQKSSTNYFVIGDAVEIEINGEPVSASRASQEMIDKFNEN